jgi:hypothetical protein
MTHLSEVAIDFVREKFVATMLDPEAKTILSELEKIVLALKHRPLNNNTVDYLSFIENQIEKTDQLQNKYPFADFNVVIKKLREKIAD